MSESSANAVRDAIASAIGAARVSDDMGRYAIDGLTPAVVAVPDSTDQLCQLMKAVSEIGLAVAPWGGGTRMAVGNRIERLDLVVDLSRLNRVVAHNPGDMTATFEAGMAVAAVQDTLSSYGQSLALDPPLPHRATIGGTLASGASGPLKWQYGNPRDVVIGMKVVQADGTLTKSGGQVVKNVSGYDMARLHIGGLGTLGIIAEVSFKLAPFPRHQATVLASFGMAQECLRAGLDIFHSHVMPLALTSFDDAARNRGRIFDGRGSHFLAVRVGGRPRTLDRQINECAAFCQEQGALSIEMLRGGESDAVWQALADFGWDDQTAPLMSARISALPSTVVELTRALGQPEGSVALEPALVSHLGYGTTLAHWYGSGGAAPDDAHDLLRRARDVAHRLGGFMNVERCPVEVKSMLDVWDDPGLSIATMRRMKEQYDPRRILNPGRFAGRI